MGRDLRDVYYHRSYYLLKKLSELERITGCVFNLEITPAWEKCVKKSYHTKGHEIDFQSDKESEQSLFDTSTGNVTQETSKKRKREKQQENVNAENACRICGITWESFEDQEGFHLDWVRKKICKCKSTTDCKHECD